MGSKGTGKPAGMDQFSEIRELMRQIREEKACLSLKDLAVNGKDLMALGYRGKAIGICLQALLEKVLEEELENTKEALMEFVSAKP